MMVLRVYAWSCCHHSVIEGFPTAFYRGMNDGRFRVFLFLCVADSKQAGVGKAKDKYIEKKQ